MSSTETQATANNVNGTSLSSSEEIDINNPEVLEKILSETPQNVDSTADYNIALPPPKGNVIYPFKYTLGSKGVYAKRTDKSGAFLVVDLIGSLVAERTSDNNYRVERYLNSIVDPRKKTSAVHHFLNLLSEPCEDGWNLRQIKEHLERVLKGEPIGYAKTDWEAQYNTGDKDANGKDIYETALRGYNRFPEDADGNKLHLVPNPINPAEKVAARLIIVADVPKPS